MYIYHNELTTTHLKNSIIKHYYDKGYSLVGFKFSFYNFKKLDKPKLACFHIGYTIPNYETFGLLKVGDTYSYYSYRESHSSLLDEKKYLELSKARYNAITVYMLFIIFVLIFLSTYVNSTISGYFGIAIALLMSMAVIRSVYYRRFTIKIYKPFLEVNGFLDEELTSRYLLNSPEPLNIEEIKCGSLKASINTLEIKDHYHNYMIETKNSKNEIESYLRKVINQNYTLTLILKD